MRETKGRHPAKFSDPLLPVIASSVQGRRRLLDPFAGTGKIATIKTMGFGGQVFCNDIEDWGAARAYDDLIDKWTFADAASLPYPDGHFDAIATSPTYGNKVNEHRDDPRYTCMTYRSHLGRPLSDANTGRWLWSKRYRLMHERIYREIFRVTAPGGIVVVNVGDFISQGKVVSVADWHRDAIVSAGFRHVKTQLVECRKMSFGRNGAVRIKDEAVMSFVKPDNVSSIDE